MLYSTSVVFSRHCLTCDGFSEYWLALSTNLPTFGRTLKLFLGGDSGKWQNSIFAKYGPWRPLNGGKIVPRVVGSFCPPGKDHPGKKKFELCLGRSNSGREDIRPARCARDHFRSVFNFVYMQAPSIVDVDETYAVWIV